MALLQQRLKINSVVMTRNTGGSSGTPQASNVGACVNYIEGPDRKD